MRHGKFWFAGWAVVMLAGCQSRYLPVDDAGHTTAALPPTTPPPASTPDTCGSGQLQYLVGKSRLQVPAPVDISKRRMVCTACVMSHLADPQRVTILFDQTTGLVTKVMCQ